MASTQIALIRGINVGRAKRVAMAGAAELAAAVARNPLLEIATEPSRLLVAFLFSPVDRRKLAPLEAEDWGREALAVGKRVAYLWCPDGILASRSAAAVARALGGAVTTRNWATVLKLRAMTGDRR